MRKEKVLLAMSGGTDSSAAVFLLQQAGYEVTGVTFRFWDENGNTGYLNDAQEVAEKAGIPHYILDKRAIFEENIVNYFISEYLQGRTPVPCVRCNNLLKWEILTEEAGRLQINKIATGHYARLTKHNGFQYIRTAADPNKDQSFFLWGLKQPVLKKAVFPLGEYTKPWIRAFATANGLNRIATKKESTSVCFCPGDYRSFLRKKLPPDQDVIRPGNFLDESGKFLGRHKGFPYYTIGQRRRLNITSASPVFVKKIIPEENVVILAPQSEIFRQVMQLKDFNLHCPDEVLDQKGIIVKIRYKKQSDYGTVTLENEHILNVKFDVPVAAIAPGQAACFYKGERVVGGGIIV